MSQQNWDFFFLLLETTDCKGWPLSNEGHYYVREFKFCLRDKSSVCHSISGSVDPRALLCSWTCFSHLLGYSVQSPEMWSWEAGSSSPWGKQTSKQESSVQVLFKISVLSRLQKDGCWKQPVLMLC